MDYDFYSTPQGDVVLLRRTDTGKSEEFSAVSAFGNSFLIFAQLVGTVSPKSILGSYYDYHKLTLEGKKCLYTVWYKQLFNYRFPMHERDKCAIVAPSHDAAMNILKKLSGIYDNDILNSHFNIEKHKDKCKGSGRAAITFKQSGRLTDGTRAEFDALERTPELYRATGGIGVIE